MIILANFIVVGKEKRSNFGRCFDSFLQVLEELSAESLQ